ncbi:MFS transporter [Fusibacter ferrireducens]|uniref:MFS transporter n=1 Tax=Fusibacter ferrireducens TaxID=2785058 RepID=A0ABR9ZX33_9FIRM|nr:MFS transporter [Fusibacter ferrireducens]MBF4695018.1 MFS transporter [Fusibacter ferrireducens]
MILKGTKTSTKLMMLQFVYYVSLATLYSYTVNILTDMGYGAFWAGILRTSMAAAAILSQAFRGYIADTFIPVKKLIIAMLSASAILSIFLLPKIALMGNPLYFVIAVTIVSFLDYTNSVDLDVWAVSLIESEKSGDFGYVRSGGSAGYALASLVFGFVIVRFGTGILYDCHAAFLLLTVIIAFSIKGIPCKNSKKENVDTILMTSAIGLLIKNRKFVHIVFAASLMFFAMGPVSSFLYLYIVQAGGDSSHLGIAWVIASVAQIISMSISSKFIRRGVSAPVVLCVALILGSVRAFTLYFPTGIWIIIILMVFHGFSYGGFTRVYTEYVSGIVPKNIVTTATTLGSAFAIGVGGMSGSLVGSFMIDFAGLNNYALLCGFIYILSMFVMWPDVRKGL